MAALLAMISAVTFGVADFLGGFASRRATAWTVVVGAQFAGLTLLVVLLPVLPPATYDAADLAWGGAAGVVGALGLTQFFRALASGSMSVVAPIAAVVTGAVPVVAGVALGERPGFVAWIGIALALPAIVLISREHVDVPVKLTRPVLVAALVAGASFGVFYVLIDRTGDGAGIQPLVAARVVSVCLIGSVGVWTSRLARPGARTSALVAASGVLDMSANVAFLYSVREGLLALGSVISAMYPASTLVLARVVLGERLHRPQLIGLVGAAVAVGLVAAG